MPSAINAASVSRVMKLISGQVLDIPGRGGDDRSLPVANGSQKTTQVGRDLPMNRQRTAGPHSIEKRDLFAE